MVVEAATKQNLVELEASSVSAEAEVGLWLSLTKTSIIHEVI
jgi:hypothetical protein